MSFLNFLPLIGTAIKGVFDTSASSYAARKDAEGRIEAQRLANEANLQMNSDNNFTNRMLADKQNQWNLDQWYRENEYNTPSAQMSRYSAAGINPYMALSQTTSGNSAASLTSADLANQKAGHVEPVPQLSPKAISLQAASKSASSMFMDALSLWQQFRSNEADIKAKETANIYQPASIEAALGKLKSDTRFNFAASDEKETVNKYLHAFYDDGSVAQADKHIKELSTHQALMDLHESFARIEGIRIANQLQSYIAAEHEEIARHMPERIFLELGMMISTINKNYNDIDVANRNATVNERNATVNERNATTNERNATSNERIAAATERNAATAEFDAETRRLLANSNIQLIGHQIRFTDTQSWYFAQEVVKTVAEANHIRLTNQLQSWMVDAIRQNLPEYMDATGFKIKGDKYRNMRDANPVRMVIKDFADFALTNSQILMNVGIGLGALKGGAGLLPIGSNSVGMPDKPQPPSFVNDWNGY